MAREVWNQYTKGEVQIKMFWLLSGAAYREAVVK